MDKHGKPTKEIQRSEILHTLDIFTQGGFRFDV